MPTLKEYAREMMQRLPGSIGRTEPISALTTTTAVCPSLATGGFSAQRYTNKWMLRRDASTSADRQRYSTAFASATGTLTHAGASYSDTTATDEILELLDYEPYLIDAAIDIAIRRLRRTDRSILPARGVREYSLANFPWITRPSDIIGIQWSANPVISENRYLRKWNTVGTGGKLLPDGFTLSGTDATMERSTTNASEPSRANVAITRSGTDCALTQSVGLLETGVDADSLRGKTVTMVAKVWASTAITLYADDGFAPATSSAHGLTFDWEWMTLEYPITSTSEATKLDFGVRVETTDTTIYVEQMFLCYGSASDNVLRGDYTPQPLQRSEYEFDQDANTIILPQRPLGSRFEIISKRPYPGFDSARLAAGTADGDISDAPLVPVATWAIARLFGALADQKVPDSQRFATIAALWEKRGEVMARNLLAEESERGFGFNLPIPSALRDPGRA